MMTVRGILADIDLGPDTGKIISDAACFSTATLAPVRLLYVMDYLLTPPSYLMPYIDEETRGEETEKMAGWRVVLQKSGVASDLAVLFGGIRYLVYAAVLVLK